MITPGFSPTATERVLPKLALDFTTASLDPRVTFTRTGNTATYINSSGYVSTINANLPRFDYNPITLACKGLLIEESRINLCQYTQDFRDTTEAGSTRPWVHLDSTTTINATISPDGTNNANALYEAVTGGLHRISQNITVSNASTYTLSCFLKGNGRQWGVVQATAGASNGYAYFDLINGVVGITGSGAVATSITNMGNSWYCCTVTLVTTATTLTYTVEPRLSNGGTNYTGDPTKGLYLWGAQVELGAFPTSYIPNLATGTTTRNADVATMTGTNFSDWYNASEGTLVAEAIAMNANTTTQDIRVFEFTNGSTSNRLLLSRNVSGIPNCVVVDTGSVQANMTSSTWPALANGKITLGYKNNNFGMCFNGGSVVTDTSGTVPSAITQMNIGCSFTGNAYWNSTIKKIFYYKQRLIDAELQAVTK